MRNYIVFLALLMVVYSSLILSDYKWVWGVILLIWLLRLVFLKRRVVLIGALFITLGFSLRLFYVEKQNVTQLASNDSHFYLEVQRETLKIDGDRLQFYAEALNDEGEKVEKVVVYFTIPSAEAKEVLESKVFPEIIVATGELKEPSSHRNFHQFDYKAFLNRQQVFWMLEATNMETTVEQETPWYHPSQWRYFILHWINQTIPESARTYIKMLIFSDRKYLDSDISDAYQDLGIIHLLSISGMHISFMINGLRYFLYRSGVTRERVPVIFLGILPLYGFLTGWGTSVYRAIGQAMIRNGMLIWGKEVSTLDIWSIVLMSALFLNPYHIFSLGFQLSYGLSLLFILLAQAPWYKQLTNMQQTLMSTFLVTLVSIPFITFHNYEFPWISLLTNTLVVPVFTFILLPLVILTFLSYLMPFTFLSIPLTHVLNAMIRLLENLLIQLGHSSHLTVVTGRLSWLALLGLSLSVLFLLKNLEVPLQKQSKSQTGLFVLVFLVSLFSNHLDPATHVVMLDVGQGDSILIKQPFYKDTILIDTGGQYYFEKEAYQQRISPYTIGKDKLIPSLKALGVSRIDDIIVTHSDIDHSGELKTLVENMTVERVLLTEQTSKELSSGVIDLLLATNFELVQAPAAYHSLKDFYFIWPLAGEKLESNDSSIVLYGKIKNDTWLFAGDIEQAAEKKLIQTYPKLHVDVLKVAHHGSLTSSHDQFLTVTQPRYGLISAGVDNRYNHPHPEIVERLESYNIKLWRTDTQGATRFSYYPWYDKPVIEHVIKKK